MYIFETVERMSHVNKHKFIFEAVKYIIEQVQRYYLFKRVIYSKYKIKNPLIAEKLSATSHEDRTHTSHFYGPSALRVRKTEGCEFDLFDWLQTNISAIRGF